jgi:hypothetical protein
MGRAIFADRQQTICQANRPFTTHTVEALAQRLRDGSDILSGKACQLLA